MRDNGTDRDVAQLMVSALDSVVTALNSINDTLYAPHITTQPTDKTAAVGTTVTFSIVATNAKGYQWQYLYNNEWRNASQTTTYGVTVTEAHYSLSFRCIVTGLDNTTVTSNVVKILEPTE